METFNRGVMVATVQKVFLSKNGVKGHVEVEVLVDADEKGPRSRSKIARRALSCIMQSLYAPFL